MPFRPCVSGCGRYLAPGDGHDRCLSCLGIEHAEAAFVDESCPHCGGMTVAGLRTRLRFLQRGGVPVPLPRSRVPPGGYRGEATSGSSRAGLTVTVRNSPSTARAPPVTGTSLPMELPRERAGPSHGGGVPLVSFGAPPDDRMSIATLEGESDQSGDDGAMSTMVVQERHLWLCLADMKEVDKARFLNAPVSQTGLFGDAVENFAQQFSAAQKQTEAIRHILPLACSCCLHPAAGGSASVYSSPRAAPCRRPRSRAADAAASSQAASWSRPQGSRPARPGPRQTRRQASEQAALRRTTQGWRCLLFGRW